MKRVAIIGAGPCGLVALKEMLEGGHEAVIFERSAELGGVFSSAAAYPNLHLTISNWAMAFSDFPDRYRLQYPSAEDYLRYLRSYADHFDLERHIRYHSEACEATLGDNRKWSLKIGQRNGSKYNAFQWQADALIVATGANHLPKPLPAELAEFDGQVIHSSEYGESFKQSVAEKKLRVLVVGGGESGADISAELGDLSPNVTVWLRRTPCVGPRYLNARDEMQQVIANKAANVPAVGFLEAPTTSRISAGQNVYAFGLFRRLIWHTPILNRTLSCMCLRSTVFAFLRNDQATYVTKNQRMCEAVHKRKIEQIVCPSIVAHGRNCVFRMPDDTCQHREFDAIVLCTGFQSHFPWLQLDGEGFSPSPRSWFLNCFPGGLGDCLFFVGYARPHQGGIPAMAEILSRYISLLLRGDRALPIDYAACARRDKAAEEKYYYLSPHIDTLVDYNSFLESVARRMGCEPRLPVSCVMLFNLHMLVVLLLVLQCCYSHLSPWSIRLTLLLWAASIAGFSTLHSGLLIKWLFYPHWSIWYRQRGPGADHELFDALLRRAGVWDSTAATPGFMLFVLWSVPMFYGQRLLSFIVFMFEALQMTLDAQFFGAWCELLCPKLFSLHGCVWRFSDLFMP